MENDIDESYLEQGIDERSKINQHSLKNKPIIEFYYMLNGILVTDI